MRYSRMLMQPFSPGRYKDRQGKSHFVSDEVWAKAFPDCKHNGKFPDATSPTDGGVQQRMYKILDRRHREGT